MMRDHPFPPDADAAPSSLVEMSMRYVNIALIGLWAMTWLVCS